MFLGSLNHKCHRLHQQGRLLPLCTLLAIAVAIGWASNENSSDPRNSKIDIPLSPQNVVARMRAQSATLRKSMYGNKRPHHETFLTLHRKPQAQQIADKMGITSFKHDSACIKCHYSMQDTGTALEPIAGVSCESCHGPRKAGSRASRLRWSRW